MREGGELGPSAACGVVAVGAPHLWGGTAERQGATAGMAMQGVCGGWRAVTPQQQEFAYSSRPPIMRKQTGGQDVLLLWWWWPGGGCGRCVHGGVSSPVHSCAHAAALRQEHLDKCHWPSQVALACVVRCLRLGSGGEGR